MGKKTQWVIAAVVLIGAILNVTAAAVNAKPTTTETHTTKVVAVKKATPKPADPYQNLSTQRQKVVKAADLAAILVVNAKLAEKSTEVITSALTDATNKAAAIEGADNDTTALREAFTNILAVVKTPSVTALKTARTSMTWLSDPILAKHLTKTYANKLIKIVAQATGQTTNAVRDASQPMSAEAYKAKQAAADQANAAAVANAAATNASTQATTQNDTTTQYAPQTTWVSEPTEQTQWTYTAPSQSDTTAATDTQTEQTETPSTSANSASASTPTTTDSTGDTAVDQPAQSQVASDAQNSN